MTPTILRVALYFVAPIIATLLPGVATYDADAQTITIGLDAMAVAIGGAGVVVAGVFAKWGKR